MFLLRSVEEADLDSLYELSQLMTFINLPQDKEIILSKIKNSISSFSHPSHELHLNHYLFVIEDTEDQTIAGVSMIHAQHGTPEEPHFYLQVGQENKFSHSTSTGFIHRTLILKSNEEGPSEIGGLVVSPKYRGHPEKLGKLISFVRFLYMGMHPLEFKEEILSELMPPFDADGKSPLWEALGRRFLDMDYYEADFLSRKNKEFILSLFPSETIYETLLPVSAKKSIGQVGAQTLPVKKMLEGIGFKYSQQIDPFDGGPHYKSQLRDIKPVSHILIGDFEVRDEKLTETDLLLLALPSGQHLFCAIAINAKIIKSGHKCQVFINKNDVVNFSVDEKFHSYAIHLNTLIEK